MEKYEVKFQNETGDIQGTHASCSLLKAIKATLKDENAAYIVDIIDNDYTESVRLSDDCPEFKIKAGLGWGSLKASLFEVLCHLNMRSDTSSAAQVLVGDALFEFCCPELTEWNKV